MFAPRDPDEYLLDSERRVIRVRLHWACLAWDIFEAVALLAVAVMVSYLLPPSMWLMQNVLWYAALFVVLRFAYQVLTWWVERIVVTDKRMMMTTGIITTKVLMMPISKVTDLTYERPLMGRHPRLRHDDRRVGRSDPGAEPARVPAQGRAGLRRHLGAGLRRQGSAAGRASR